MPPQKKKKPLPDLFDDPIRPQATPLPDLFDDPQQEPGILEQIANAPGVQPVLATISPVLNFLSRPNYASAKFADALLNDSKDVFDAAIEGFSELFAETWFNPDKKQSRISYSDVIRRANPEFARDNPNATSVLGFLADVALDPTTYLGFGLAKNGIKVGGKVLTRFGKEGIEEGVEAATRKVFIGKKGTLELVEDGIDFRPAKAQHGRALQEPLRSHQILVSPHSTGYITLPKGKGVKVAKTISADDFEKISDYFAAVRTRQDEVEALFAKIAGDKKADVALNVARDETLADLRRFGFERMPEDLFEDEVFERISTRILKLTETDKDLRFKLFEKPGLYLKAGIPFVAQTDVMRLLGLEGLHNKVKAITSYMEAASFTFKETKYHPFKGIVEAGRTLGKAFNRDFGLPEWYIQARNDLENHLQYVKEYTYRDTLQLFQDVDKKGIERIQSALLWADDETRRLEQLRALSSDDSFKVLTDGEAGQILQQGFERFGLTETEHAIAMRLHLDYKEAGLLEMRAGLLKNNLINYSPRGYELVDDPIEMALVVRNRRGDMPAENLISSRERKYLTNEEAKAAGFEPELDAAMIYAQRMLMSRRALSIKQFKDSVEDVFGTTSTSGKFAKTGIMPTTLIGQPIPRNIIDDLRMIGEASYPIGMNTVTRNFVMLFDNLQRHFKRGATTIRPSFAIKQVFSNTFQSAMVSGVRAFKSFDPRAAIDAAILLGNRGLPTRAMPQFVNDFIGKFFGGDDAILASRQVWAKITGEDQLRDFAKGFKLRNAFGQEFTGEELITLMREHSIIRGFDSTGEEFTRKISREIGKDRNTYGNVVGELAKVWNHAGLVEDYSRAILFLNGIRMGYSARGATRLVNKALFDYANGLSHFEKQWMRRIIPFYTFQRFAIPYVLQRGLAQPGTIATKQKVFKLFEKLLMTGETLTPAEEHSFGDTFLVSQPGLGTGFDKSGKLQFNVLNNLTPFDVLNFMVFDKKGDVDIQRTVEKSVLGAITPFLKVPLQAVLQKDFFTGQTIQKATTYGDLEGSLGKILPDFAKDLVGWETRKNQITGRVTTYVSPFMGYYAMQFFPALRDFVNPLEDVQLTGMLMGPLEGAMRIIAEASTPSKRYEVDLKATQQWQLLQSDKKLNTLIREIELARIKGSKSEYDERMYEYQLFLKTLSEDLKMRKESVRGQGLNQKFEEGQEEQLEPKEPVVQPQFK